MATDFHIPLGIQVPKTEPPNYLQQLMQVQQIRDMQQQEQYRSLQALQLQREMQDIEAATRPGGAMQALRDLGGRLPARDPNAITQAPLPVAEQASQPSLPIAGPGPQALQYAAQGPTVQPLPQAQQQAQAPAQSVHGQWFNAMEDLYQQHPWAAARYGPQLMQLRQQRLAQEKIDLEHQRDTLGMIQQGAAAVLRLPPEKQAQGWATHVGFWQRAGFPGAEQLSPQFDRDQVTAIAEASVSAKDSIELQIKASEAATKDLEARIKRGTMQQPIMTEAGGVAMPQVVGVPGAPGPQFVPAPGGGVAGPVEQGRLAQGQLPSGEIGLYRENIPRREQPRLEPLSQPPRSGYAPGTGAPAEQPAMLVDPKVAEEKRKLSLEERTKQLESARPLAQAGQQLMGTLDQIVQEIRQGYDAGFLVRYATQADVEKALRTVQKPEDRAKLLATRNIKQLANQLINQEQLNHIQRVNPQEIDILKGMLGNLETVPSKAAALKSIDTLRRTIRSNMDNYNTLVQVQNENAPAGTAPIPRFTYKRVIPKEVFQKQLAKEENRGLSPDQLALRYERAGWHVEGVE